MLDTGSIFPTVSISSSPNRCIPTSRFWQMIGRGTRLSPNLLDRPTQNPFSNFRSLGQLRPVEQGYKTADPKRPKSLCERVFEARLKLAEAALEKQNTAAFELATKLIAGQIADLPRDSIPIKESWKQVHSVSSEEIVGEFSAATKATLQQNIAPLMQWVDIAKYEEAYQFDRLIAQTQAELIRGGGKFADLRDAIVNLVSSLQINLSRKSKRRSRSLSASRAMSFGTILRWGSGRGSGSVARSDSIST